MNGIKKLVGIFAAFLGGIFLVSACIFPFTHLTGVHGYASIVIGSSIVLALIGGLMLQGSGRSSPTMHDLQQSGQIDPRILEEMRNDRNRGKSLGMELFYIGVGCAAVGYLLFKIMK